MLVVIFALLLFTFQVRQSEVAVVTTFGKITGPAYPPGLHLKWPWPIQQVYKFDERIQNFDDKFNETLTKDQIDFITSVYVGWRISDPSNFLNSFKDGSVEAAQTQLESILRSVNQIVVGNHPLADFVNADPAQLRFDQIQHEIEQKAQQELSTNSYGIQIVFLGLKQFGLPEGVTQAVFDRMKSERQVLVNEARYEGQKEAEIIKANANRQAADTLADANAAAKRIQGQGEAEAAKTLPVFQENPGLANFLLRVSALQQSLNQKSTLIFDQRTPPFDLFTMIPTNSAAK
ncbi:MAG: protease modulator HflC [Verrucomicrobia bacterium]|nr:protease modulator HflC [Verrucomicrobiota bacterium]